MRLKSIIIAVLCALLGACSSAPEPTKLRPDVLYFEDGPKAREAAAEITQLYGGRQEVAVVSERMPPVTGPAPKVRQQPVYPIELKRAGISGTVIVDAIVGETGAVLYTAVIKSTDERLNAPALDAVRRWQFKPAHRGNQPIRCRLRIPIAFSMTAAN